ncbi:Hypothetical predicted protein [Mytilus galloprovincialis]|uniref:EGF-like domain-containing protein n=1 Tax=Mytilus galloprovincialis TaxID=29158 RepID=A0A8B6GS26_MYTGA|nr:Hypothetical predicted protein [Mytilus galloprovincialis]
MSHYQSIQSSVQSYLSSIPQGLQLTHHTRTTDTGHFLILHLKNDPVPVDSNPVQVKQEPMEYATNIKQEPTIDATVKMEPMDQDIQPTLQDIKQEKVKPSLIRWETTPEKPSTTQTELAKPSVYSRLGEKQQYDNSYSSNNNRNRRCRRHNKKRSTDSHNSVQREDLRTYLNQKKQTMPKDLRALIPRRLPLIMEQLQYGSLPLGKNETFPVNYYLDRGDVQEVNIQSDNKTTHIDLTRPLPGDWFAIAYIPDKDTKLRPKGLFATCYYRLNVELTSTVLNNIDSIHLYHNYKVRISKPVIYRFNILETTSAYHVLVSGCTNATGIPVSCLVDVITRGQGVPDLHHYDNNVIAVSCGNKTVNVSLDIQSDRCVEGRCNDKGSCAVYLQGRLLVSTCVCQGGWSGYACNDGSDLIPGHEQLTELILLTVSHVMFIPAVILALYRTHYVEAFVYFYTMFFSAFYHACDGGRSDEYKYCIINLSVLSFCDFLGSVTSIWVTLIAMTKLPRTIRSVLYTAGPLLIAMGIELERTSLYMFVVPGALGALFIAISWARKCYGRRKCYPPCKRYLLCLLPGLLIAGGGLCIFAFAENNQNYKYTHSVWHMLMATCTMFLLPPKPKKREPLFGSNEGGRQCLSSCLADDPNSTPLTSFRDTESLENLII